ncbi:MAG: ubiquinone/menaquinone biosynthesis methyltransferase [Actinobacteria bacterium]|nr:ubiquinone/menaquinone biosynthesis methyltransferase [Actinomycetota bacterium]MBT3688186.1 ubiquinone/menaquinone biosynthesis methyltransferase [Actinomycetota bacterium]MBT4038177.1 ubiquinone/menaquinone biosynthesis methyltransferase [Actinomycetota bacterium]MBT4278301.1 ubiquinone/menaquinone biosynthesis methyltransferase [Actinomycetota bacterium]MBT4342945.1 ubiquinone/menaquinone biosynthesis methyltransferase [Actinomycetota bacterium]
MSGPADPASGGQGAPLPRGEAKSVEVRRMFDSIAPRYDLMNRIMTFRLDVAWRRRTVAALDLPGGSTVMDVACGTGDLCRDLHRAGHRAIGLDMSWGMLAAARTDAPLLHADALLQPARSGAIDGLSCGFALRNFTALEPFLSEAARLLRQGGRMALLEVDRPTSPVLRAGHGLYFGKVVPLVGGLFSDRDAYRYLPRSVAYLPPEPELLAMIAAAGFSDVDKVRLSGGIAQLITATRS